MDVEFECERATKALAALGDTADEVARTLRALGVTGVPSRAQECVIARYLGAELSTVVRVDPVDVSFWAVDSKGYSRIETPQVILGFIRRFDRHEYPELISLSAV